MAFKLISIIFLFVHLQIGFAHPPGLSSADLTVKPEGVDTKITFAVQDIEAFVLMDTDEDAEVTAAERNAAKPGIANFVANELKIQLDGSEAKPVGTGIVNFDNQNNATVELGFAGTPASTITIESKFLGKLPADHKQYVTVKDAGGHELGKKMLTQKANTLEINLKTSAAPAETDNHPTSTFIDFLKLGVEHILTGYDHLLFLFSLLVVTRSFWPAIKIITFFTIAHSITLALAGLNIVDIPSSIVEPLIAATIVYVGLENIIRGDRVTTRNRCLLTFFFGLIHGFGFAGVLREMGISSIETGILLPLFSFNLGVELGQITVAAIVLPLIWWLHGQGRMSRLLVPVGSILTCIAGGYWLLERTVLN
ncbi:HupE/UreJ family protein [Methyloglobulus sp.]|uniref:HupE/UreJ family protein n=1 Tax=Methyloglobulus sp. TaxID=2518622 RepID=UPI003988E03A